MTRSRLPRTSATAHATSLESLENRRLLAFSVSNGGTLTVLGTKNNDDVVISADSQNPNLLAIRVNNQTDLVPAAGIKAVFVNLGRGNDKFIFDATFGAAQSKVAVRTVLGGEGDDSLGGSIGNDSIDGQGGNDTISGRQGNDTLLGGAGADRISGGNGNDVADGGVDGDFVETGAGDDSLRGGGGNDFMHGGTEDDTLRGEDGNDSLEGCRGRDVLFGDAGNDVLDGNLDPDTVRGGEGNDIVTGNFGNDVPGLPADVDALFGEGGNDDFDPLDAASEVKDRTAGDDGDNGFVPDAQGVKDILDDRAFV